MLLDGDTKESLVDRDVRQSEAHIVRLGKPGGRMKDRTSRILGDILRRRGSAFYGSAAANGSDFLEVGGMINRMKYHYYVNARILAIFYIPASDHCDPGSRVSKDVLVKRQRQSHFDLGKVSSSPHGRGPVATLRCV